MIVRHLFAKWRDAFYEQSPEMASAQITIAAVLAMCLVFTGILIVYRPQLWEAAIGMGLSLACICLNINVLLHKPASEASR